MSSKMSMPKIMSAVAVAVAVPDDNILKIISPLSRSHSYYTPTWSSSARLLSMPDPSNYCEFETCLQAWQPQKANLLTKHTLKSNRKSNSKLKGKKKLHAAYLVVFLETYNGWLLVSKNYWATGLHNGLLNYWAYTKKIKFCRLFFYTKRGV